MSHRNVFNPYIRKHWRDIYRPITRYPEIYKEHRDAGRSLLTEDAPGYWDLATKPLGALMYSGIPALYESLRDEPIRNTLRNDLGFSQKAADYTTQGIGLGLDIGLPYSVIKHGLTPWISEAVRKSGNVPDTFSPSRRRFLQGAGAVTVAGMGGPAAVKLAAKKAGAVFISPFTKAIGGLFTLVKGVKHLEDFEPLIRERYIEMTSLHRLLDSLYQAKHGEQVFPRRVERGDSFSSETAKLERQEGYPGPPGAERIVSSSKLPEVDPILMEGGPPLTRFQKARKRRDVYRKTLGEDWKNTEVDPTIKLIDEKYDARLKDYHSDPTAYTPRETPVFDFDLEDMSYYREFLEDSMYGLNSAYKQSETLLRQEPELFMDTLNSLIRQYEREIAALQKQDIDVIKGSPDRYNMADIPAIDPARRRDIVNVSGMEKGTDIRPRSGDVPEAQVYEPVAIKHDEFNLDEGVRPYSHPGRDVDLGDYSEGGGGYDSSWGYSPTYHADVYVDELAYLKALREEILSQEGTKIGQFTINKGNLRRATESLPKKKKKEDGNLLQRILDPLGYKNIKW